MAKKTDSDLIVQSNDNGTTEDMGALMAKMQDMMKKMNDIDNMDDDEAENMLQKMLGDVNKVTQSVQGQFKNLTKQLMDNPDIPDSEKEKYKGLEKNLGQLTNALSKQDANPEEMEKTLNSLMGNLKNTMNDLTGDNHMHGDLESRIEKLEDRFDKLENIVRKIADRLKK